MLGKTEVSFEQWYHKVQCVKDHYPESVVWESIVRLLKGAVVDMAQYMGLTTSVAHILQTLTVIVKLNYVLNLRKQNKFLSKHKLSPVNLTWLSQVYGKMFNFPKC